MKRQMVVGLGTCCFVMIPWSAIAVGPQGKDFIDKALEVLDNPRWYEKDPFLTQEPVGGRLPEKRPSYGPSAIEGRELSCILGVMAESWRSSELLEQIEKYARRRNRKVALQSTAHLVDVGKWSLRTAQAFAAEQKWSSDEIRQIGRLLASKAGRNTLAEAQAGVGKARFAIRLQVFKNMIAGMAQPPSYRYEVLVADDADRTGNPSYETVAILPHAPPPGALEAAPGSPLGAITTCASDGALFFAIVKSGEEQALFRVWRVPIDESGTALIDENAERPFAETARAGNFGLPPLVELSAVCEGGEIVLTSGSAGSPATKGEMLLNLASKQWRLRDPGP